MAGQRRFGTRELGLVYGIGASGALIGALVAPRAATTFGLGSTILIGAVLGSTEVLPVALATPKTPTLAIHEVETMFATAR